MMRTDREGLPTGPPLDVFTPLRHARDHATGSLVTLVLASATVFLLVLYEGDLLGWPRIDHRVEGEVVAIEQIPDGTVVTFTARGGGREVRWSRSLEDSSWEVGQGIEGWIDEEGRFHADHGFGWAGPPTFFFFWVLAGFVVFAARRLLGLWIAWWDLHRRGDEPRLGFAALVADPTPKTWRPLLAIWWEDPTDGSRLARPDGTYRADDETGGDLASSHPVQVWRAWIDTGRFAWTKPRWVGVRDNILIPHRRAAFGRWYVWMVTRKARVDGPEPMLHGPPDPLAAPAGEPPPLPRHDFRKMLLLRLAAVLALAVAAGFLTGEGEAVTTVGFAAASRASRG